MFALPLTYLVLRRAHLNLCSCAHLQETYSIGSRAAKAWADSEGGKVAIPPVADNPKSKQPLKPHEKAAVASKIGELLSGGDGKENSAALDGFMQSQVNPLASDIIKLCLPDGLAVPFPENVSLHSLCCSLWENRSC